MIPTKSGQRAESSQASASEASFRRPSLRLGVSVMALVLGAYVVVIGWVSGQGDTAVIAESNQPADARRQISAGSPEQVAAEPSSQMSMFGEEYQFSLSGGQVAWLSGSGDQLRLNYSQDSGAAKVHELGALLEEDSLAGWQLAPNGLSALLRVRSRGSEKTGLHWIDLSGSSAAEPQRLIPAHPQRSDVMEFAFSPASDAVVYLANRDDYAKMELYVSWLSPFGQSSRLNQPLATGGNVTRFEFADNGAQVVFRADPEQDERYNLYSVSLAQPGAVRQLNPPGPEWMDVAGFRVSADGQQVFYRADDQQMNHYGLHRVSIFTPGVAETIAAPEFEAVDLPFGIEAQR